MSGSTYAGRLVVEEIGTVAFSTAPTDRGRVPTGLQAMLQELTADGVDNRRWRRRNWQYATFRMMTTADGASWQDGLDTAELYEHMSGQSGTLTLITRGITKTWKRVKILDCRPNLQPGSLIGFGADAASSYVLDAAWTLVITEPST